MSPLYAYVCKCENEVEKIRSYGQRLDPVHCPVCGKAMEYRISAHHQAVDGIYSYAPNEGNPDMAEKAKMRARGEKWDTSA